MDEAIDLPPRVVPPSFMRRLLRRKSAIVSLVGLIGLAFAALVGPWLYPHPYDRVYRDFVLVPPSFAAHPTIRETVAALDDFSQRMHVAIIQSSVGQKAAMIELAAETPIDERLLRYFTHSDIFMPAHVVVRADAGRKLSIYLPLRRFVFPFGTDSNGRDLLSRIFIALRISLAVGFLAALVALSLGVAFGGIAGYVGGRVDLAMMRLVEIIYALPFIFFVILLTVFLGRNFILIFVAIGAVEWLDMARIVRGETLSVKRRDYVAAAEALGAGPAAIFWRHVLPNMLAPIAAFLTLLVPRVILAESFVSFLGLGVQEPLTSLGLLIADGARMIQSAPYLLIFPALVLALTLAALNILGDALTQAVEGHSQ
ncbi:MAG: ABC transporter permease [Methylovirgula sp.]